ncbi:MAG: D-alanyl-D-alanine carboxypeptidase/D-alanyl-D-alanine-endopeptidase [Phycisphaeraceae bacterium]|nr:D-alanyl-D-alanine carboxypeptidase/D-alanyl-D-alanine-endopeptidase [Phycisphaeraceae bacterium]MCW5754222.1 D-alanyl-D-alanine carboxypeptidase/D-alanyl-D-alanine-endopeptidase [Phycisphaeraceae bacterium]
MKPGHGAGRGDRGGWVAHLAACVVLAVLGLAPAPVTAASRVASAYSANPTIARDIETLVRDARLGSARVGVSVVDLGSMARLAGVEHEAKYIPASNMKVLTTGAALAVLGPEYVFRTELILSGDVLVLKGAGDPALGDPEFLKRVSTDLSAENVLNAMARAVHDAKVTSIREIVVDDRVFDRQYVHPRWPADQLDRHYCAAVGGVNFHRNVLDFYARPAPDGVSAPDFTLEPRAPWISREVRIGARTVTTGRHTAWVRRDMRANRFALLGDVRYPAQAPARVALHDPALFAGQLLADRLASLGVVVGSTPGGTAAVAQVRLAASDERFDEGRVLAVVTTPLADIVQLCNVDSVNLYAEALLKLLGHAVSGESGSWETGASVLRMVLAERLGPQAATNIVVSDGSGMSRDNEVSPALLTTFLASMYRDPQLSSVFVASLPEAGDGTLRRRFREVKIANEVRAKSGYLNGVRTLSGYVIHRPSGRAVGFSILINDLSGAGATDARALKLHEDIVSVIDRYLTAASGATVSATP